MIAAGQVAELWRYPVKSLGGERRRDLDFDERGAVGDRAFALYGSDGKIGSGKTTRRFRRMDGLLDYAAVLESGEPVIACPDGRRIGAGDGAANEMLSVALQEAIEVRREGTIPHFDAGAVHLLSRTSLRWLAARMGETTLPDARRFRPNIMIDLSDGDGRPEEEWIGRVLCVGPSVRLHVGGTTQRCVMTTMSQQGLPTDGRVLRCLAQDNDSVLGVYASVRAPGRVRVGDSIHLLP